MWLPLFITAASLARPSEAAVLSLRISPQEAPVPPAAEPVEEPVGTTPGFQPQIRPTLHVSPADGGIEIDGELDDPGWRSAARATDFSTNFPEEMGEPDVASEAWITYDEENLYVAFVAYDDPAKVRASLRDRDEIWQDDYFGILLDTYGDATWAYFLFANPLGIQGDTRQSVNSGEDVRFDVLYYAAGQVTDFGYVVELRIPFASLRFPDAPEQEWRATFWRNRPRASREQHTWAALDRDDSCFLCQFGTLTGIWGVRPGGALELLPTLVASQAGELADPDDPASGLDNEGLKVDPGFGVRYSFPVGITMDAALNPDFSQVESDVAQIDVNTTFALFFPERRPLFQEGSDVFVTPVTQVYTRSINDPIVVGKAIGRTGRTTLGYIGGVDETSPILIPFEERSFVGQTGGSVSNIARFQRSFGDDSHAGILFTDRRFLDHGGSNTSVGANGQLRFLSLYRLVWQLAGSHTREPNDTTLTEDVNDLAFDGGRHTAAYDGEAFWGSGAWASVERDARLWNFFVRYAHLSPTFRADNGFETRNDFRRVAMFQGLTFQPRSGFVDEIAPGIWMRREWNFRGVKKQDNLEAWVGARLKGQTFAQVEFEFASERFREVDFNGMRRFEGVVDANFSDPVKLGFWLSHGDQISRGSDVPVLGRGTNAEAWGTIKLFRRLTLEPAFQYATLADKETGEEIFDGYIFRLRANLHFTRELFLRFVAQWDDFDGALSLEPLLTFRLNPFSVFYVGATSGYADFGRRDDLETPAGLGLVHTQRQFFAKFQYLFRF